MFNAHFFATRFFPARYFPKTGGTAPTVTLFDGLTTSMRLTGVGH